VAKLSVSQTLSKANMHEKKGEIVEAQKLYIRVLDIFPNNKKAQHSLANLNRLKKNIGNITPPKNIITQLVKLYSQGNLISVIEQSQKLINQYPESFVIWNLLGAANKGLGRVGEASDAFRKVIALNPLYAGGYSNLGTSFHEQGKLHDALKFYKKAIALQPNYAEAYSNMGNTFKELGKFDEAIKSYNKALSFEPNYADAYFNMGVVFNEQGNSHEAIKAYNKALTIKPDYAEAYNNIGNTLKVLEKLPEAIDAFNKSLILKPDYLDAYNNIGNTYLSQEKLDKAINAYKRALKFKSDCVEAWINGADALEKWNKLDQLTIWLKKASENFEKIPSDIIYFQSKLHWRKKEVKEASKLILSIDLKTISDIRKQGFLNLKAKCFESSNDFAQAYECFLKMNHIAKESESYLNSNSEIFYNNIKDQLNRLKLKSLNVSTNAIIDEDAQIPIFLVGFPRSGTTLMDTILRSHSAIEVLEEKPTIVAAKTSIRNNGYIDIHSTVFPPNIILQARKAYLNEFKKHIKDRDSKLVCIDKLPLNLLEVPLIHQLFPNAKFILALRHPFDTILSCWMQDFEINAAMANMVDLDRIVELYCIAMETFKICRSEYNLNVHTIRYEDLLNDLKGESSPLLNFLGLNWESKMEDYRATALKRGRINTPSYAQVSQPIYKDAKYRWVNYKHYLKKYSDEIEPWIDEFGYKNQIYKL